MPCKKCVSLEVSRALLPHHVSKILKPEGLAELAARALRRLVERHGPDALWSTERPFAGAATPLAPHGYEPPRICSVCERIYCPKVEPERAAAPTTEPAAEKKEDPRDLFGLLDVQDDEPEDP